MDSADPRTRSQITLNPTRVLNSSVPSKYLQRVIISNAFSSIALYAGREWLLRQNVGVFWVLMRVLACGGVGALIWAVWTGQTKTARRKSVEWSVLGLSSIALLLQQACLLTALLRLSPLRVIILTHIYTLWPQTLLTRRPVHRLVAIIFALALSFLADAQYSSLNFQPMLIAYGSLLVHSLATLAFDHAQNVLSPAIGSDLAAAASTLGAAALGLPLYGFRRALVDHPPSPFIPITSLAAIPLLAYSLFIMSSGLSSSLRALSSPARLLNVSYPTTVLFASATGIFAFSQWPAMNDLAVAVILFYGLYTKLGLTEVPAQTPTTRLIRVYMKTILANPESRKIFYFLVLNMVYMLVQLLYGVWTNSLGLISDAIHMAFDCLAIGVGLLASVMATWDPNERFTYGYGRIETLSGFANGIFLILISIFIIFEAIQRLIDPPEMETGQLLLVSSVGLGVNLFGMFAMGGHHHHGHSHSHGHSHGSESSHGHSHAASPVIGNGHDHSHSSPSHDHSHGGQDHYNGDHSRSLEYQHSHASSHSHSHSPHSPGSGSDHEDDHHSHAEHGHSDSGHHSHTHSHSDDEHRHTSSYGRHTEDDHHSHTHPHEESEGSHSHTHSHHNENGEHHHGNPHASANGHSALSHPVYPDTGASPSHDRLGEHLAPPKRPLQKRQFSGPSLQIPPAHGPSNPHLVVDHDLSKPSPVAKAILQHKRQHSAVPSPLTPNYSFTHDEHYDEHHSAVHVPNAHSHSHSHGHGHEGHSDNMRGVFLHVMADTLGSVGVIISTLLIQFYGWTGFDPIASLFIAILIVASVVPLVIDTGKILCLDASDRKAGVQSALAELSSIPGLASYTNPRFWSKDSSSLVGSIHIQLQPSAASFDPTGPHRSTHTSYSNLERVVERVDTLLRSQIRGLEELTIQVEGA